MEASVCGEAGPAGSLPADSPASNGHRAWYEQNPAGSAGSPLASSNSAASGATSSDQLDAYFKGSNAVNTAAYFSQMQGAYPGMSYHGNYNFILFRYLSYLHDWNKIPIF